MKDKKNSRGRSRRAVKRERRNKRERRRNTSSGSRRILSPQGLLFTAFMAVCFGFPGITEAETWPVHNEFMICVRLAACTGAVVLAVLAVQLAYNGRKLPAAAGLIFGGCYLLSRLPVGGTVQRICNGISLVDAVICVIAGILPAFLVYLILRVIGGRIPADTVYQIVRWILTAVAGFLFGNFLYRVLSGRRSGSDRRRKKKNKREKRKRRDKKSQKRKRKNRNSHKENSSRGDDKEQKDNPKNHTDIKEKADSSEEKKSDDMKDLIRTEAEDDLPALEDISQLTENSDDNLAEDTPAASCNPDDISGKIITKEDGCTGFVRNHNNGKLVVLFEDGSSSEIRIRGNKYYYESRPGVWTVITDEE